MPISRKQDLRYHHRNRASSSPRQCPCARLRSLLVGTFLQENELYETETKETNKKRQ